MPLSELSIALPNTPGAVKRTVDCTFVYNDLEVHVRIPSAIAPEVSPAIEEIKAKQLLNGIAQALLDAT
jgi:hypothetical protein